MPAPNININIENELWNRVKKVKTTDRLLLPLQQWIITKIPNLLQRLVRPTSMYLPPSLS